MRRQATGVQGDPADLASLLHDHLIDQHRIRADVVLYGAVLARGGRFIDNDNVFRIA
ncbi:hypothetical protein [Streptomyces noursei]|uniref:hypothetical protein n=1 Tax=Streptomyces noursei TaxID=1971 RepID=UPI0030F1250B